MPLTMAKPKETQIIRKIGGREETRKFLEGMGFITGGEITVVSQAAGNVIVSVKGSRIAIGKEMADKILV
ncbi:MAG: ferrous iron transport protein A [Lachnospiraceae bacterium]|nr:ferrous iron transport protein A [Lachnospiraceae bacterium]